MVPNQIADPLILLPLCSVIYGRSPKSLRSSNLFLWSPWPRQSPISFLSKMIASQDFFSNLIRVHSIAEKKNHNNKKKRSKLFLIFWPREMRGSWISFVCVFCWRIWLTNFFWAFWKSKIIFELKCEYLKSGADRDWVKKMIFSETLQDESLICD